MSGIDFDTPSRKTSATTRSSARSMRRGSGSCCSRSCIVGFLSLVILFSAWQRFALLGHGYEMQRMQRERAEQEEINRHLRLEIETLRSPARIEHIATRQLHLIAPTRDQAIVLERVTPSAPPEKSIVAAR